MMKDQMRHFSQRSPINQPKSLIILSTLVTVFIERLVFNVISRPILLLYQLKRLFVDFYGDKASFPQKKRILVR